MTQTPPADVRDARSPSPGPRRRETRGQLWNKYKVLTFTYTYVVSKSVNAMTESYSVAGKSAELESMKVLVSICTVLKVEYLM